VDLDANLIRIWEGKGRKDRIIPLGQRASMWIEKYLQEVRCIQTIGKSEDRLFLTAYNTPFSRKSFPIHVRKYVKAAQIDKKGACHLFRHAMAIGMLKNGADIRYIQEMLGHSCLTSTQIYTEVSIEKLKEIHTNTHPAQKEVKDAQSKQKL
jgi:integrase/recombinase XerD